MCAKNHLLTFSSFLDIWENVEWPRFFGPPGIVYTGPLIWNQISPDFYILPSVLQKTADICILNLNQYFTQLFYDNICQTRLTDN